MSIETVDIHGKSHPTYAGVLNLAHEEGLTQIKTELLQAPLEENHYMAIVKASVTTKKGVFEGIGDATPKNVNKMIAPHIVRMAETRAKGRALRDALNIAEALAEELGNDNDDLSNNVKEALVDDFDVEDNFYKDNQKCKKCGAKMVKNPKTGKWFCSEKCWLNK